MSNIFFEEYKDTFDGSIPFSAISEEMYEPAIDRGIEKANEEIKRIADNPEPPTFSNTIEALSRCGADLDRVMNAFGPLSSVLSTDFLRNLRLKLSPRLAEFHLGISMNDKLWERTKYIYDHRDEFNLDSEQLILLENRYNGFKAGGALLKGEIKEEFKRLVTEQPTVITTFANNVINELNSTKVDITVEQAGGIEEDLVNKARVEAEKAGLSDDSLRFGLDQPTYMSVLKTADNRDVRRKFYLAYNGRNMQGEFNNLPLISRIAEYRRRISQILGYKNAAEINVEFNMAHTPENVLNLLDELREAYREPLVKEMAELTDFAGHELQPWDYSYYSDKLRNERFQFDEEVLRPYLVLDNIIDSMFALAGELYGLTFTLRDDIEKYHPDVKVYSVNDADGSYVGLLYMDFFTRETKRPGAWMTEFRGQRMDENGDDIRPHITIVTNFAPGTENRPALLRPRDVETLLHEFGHALHGLLSRCRYEGTSGTNVRRDFVELPSQMNEGFATCDYFLSRAARHYKDGSPLPQELVKAWRDSINFGAAYQCMRQLSFGYLDMAWHMLSDAESSAAAAADPVKFEREATESVKIFDNPDSTAISPQFSHIFAGGYAAGYYSYKWSEVLAADAFESMLKDGEINKEAALSFRKNILERGGSEDPAILYRNFRGRDADVKALLRRDGLA